MGLSIDRKPKKLKVGAEENHLKKAALTFIILVCSIIIAVSASFIVKPVNAANSQEYSIERVDHTAKILYNGYVFLNDTIRIEGKAATDTAIVESFRLGFPHKYGQSILRTMAFNGSASFEVTSDAPLDDRMGFYAVEITFPQPLSVKNGIVHVFTVGFVLSNTLLQQDTTNATSYTLDFPAYPGLTKPASSCNGLVVLPGDATFLSGTVAGFAYNQTNLPAFNYSQASVTFSMSGAKLLLVDVPEMRREVAVNEFGGMSGSDTYRITNKMQNELAMIQVLLPLNASGVQAEDQFGRTTIKAVLTDARTSRYNVTFGSPLTGGNSTLFRLKYGLPSEVYRTKQAGSADSFDLDFPLFQDLDSYIGQSSTTFVLPEGARLQSFEKTSSTSTYSLTRSVFQETLAVTKQNVISLDHFDVKLSYVYNSIWLAFRPALWVWALAIVGSMVAVVWKRPKGPVEVVAPTVAVRMRPESLREFSDAYEEKLKIILELDALETKVEKGKIPRRRYKVQKETMRTRLSTLSHTLDEYKEKMRTAGGHYSELMLQLEVAESEIKEVDNALRNDGIRHNQGELSLEAFKKRQDDYRRRKEKAEATINGILLRFREETR
jgi:hypothetical protein